MARLDTRWRRVAALAVGVVASFGVIGALVLPLAVRWSIETLATSKIGRSIRVESITANPYTLRVTLKGLTVEGQAEDPAPLFSVREASVNASVSSLFRGAPVLQAITVQGLTANIVRIAPQRFNFTDIVERLQAKPKTSETPALFSLNNIEIIGSTLNFDDRVAGTRHSATDIRIGIPFLSNLPGDEEITVQPAFAANIDGTPMELTGETRMFHENRESSIAIKLDGLDLAKYLGYSPVRPNFVVGAGLLGTDLRVAFKQAVAARAGRGAQPAKVLITGQLRLNGLSVSGLAGTVATPHAAFKSVSIGIEQYEPLEGRLVLSELEIDAPDVLVTRDRSGAVDWLRIVQQPFASAGGAAAVPEQTGAGASAFAFTLKHATIANGSVKFVDESVGRFEQEVVNLQAEAGGLTTAAADRGTVRVTADIKDNGRISLDGELGLMPLGGRLNYNARDVRLTAAARYLANVVNGTLDGRSDIGGTLELETTHAGLQVTLRDVVLAGTDVKIRGPAESGAALDIAAVHLSGGVLELTGRSITVEKLTIDSPRLLIRRLGDGSINWLHLAKLETGREVVRDGVPAPWSIRVKQTEVTRGDVRLEDDAVTPAVKLRASAITVTARNITGDGSEQAEFTLRCRLGGGGALSAKGNARWDTLAAALRVDARNLDIAAIRPYLASHLNAVVAKAEFSGQGTVALARPIAGGALRVEYKGSGRLSNVHALDAAGETDLLRWQMLDVEGIDLKIGEGSPFIDLGKVSLGDFYARVIVSEEGRLNLADLVKRDGAPPTVGAHTAQASSAAADLKVVTPSPAGSAGLAGGSPWPAIRIGAVEIVRGNVHFTDNFIRPNYTANITGLGGSVSTLASNDIEPATVSLVGSIDGDAPLEINGRVNPLAPTLFLDIEGRTAGVDLPRLTPYAVKYAGYPIVKGKVSMDIKYKVEAQKLEASNHLFLDQLTFGDRVESPTATKLPVLLAVSLLKNHRGEIDINLPISGSLDDPKFSVGGVIVQVIANLLAKVVTAPFALLASAFGGGEELGFVEFAPGADTLAAGQLQRLDALSKALNERPGLRLDIVGRAEPDADTEGVRRAKYEARLTAAKLRRLTRAGGGSIDPSKISIDPEERPALIAAAYSDEKIADKPRNVIGMVKSIPTAEMESLILNNLAAGPEDLRALATARAAAVRNYLEITGGVARDRLFLVEPRLTADDIRDSGARTRVDFLLK
jgi:uncharacterized protein involved in outer membrane biogenesis